jgi:hypothetical protein
MEVEEHSRRGQLLEIQDNLWRVGQRGAGATRGCDMPLTADLRLLDWLLRAQRQAATRARVRCRISGGAVPRRPRPSPSPACPAARGACPAPPPARRAPVCLCCWWTTPGSPLRGARRRARGGRGRAAGARPRGPGGRGTTRGMPPGRWRGWAGGRQAGACAEGGGRWSAALAFMQAPCPGFLCCCCGSSGGAAATAGALRGEGPSAGARCLLWASAVLPAAPPAALQAERTSSFRRGACRS